ncbi:MAG: DNA-processing protein DprA [bacterium]
MDDREYLLGLQLIPGLGPHSRKNLLKAFGSPDNIFNAPLHELSRVDLIGPKRAGMIKKIDIEQRVERELRLMGRKGIHFLTIHDPGYPHSLRNIFDAPHVLFVQGEWREYDHFSISIVGSRKASLYGKTEAFKLAQGLSQRGITVISGMARGIDTVAHKGALSVQGRTVAVLGSGLDVIYPPENKNIMSAICRQGAVFSEFPLGTRPLKQNFPMRNRIIAGLSLGTIVIEAGAKSGALITAYQALEQGKEVFALPGNISSPTSKGTNSLIKQGAKLVDTVDDIIDELKLKLEPLNNYSFPNREKKERTFSEDEKMLLHHLSDNPQHIDTLVIKSGLPAHTLSALLLDLEMEQVIKQLPGRMFVKF